MALLLYTEGGGGKGKCFRGVETGLFVDLNRKLPGILQNSPTSDALFFFFSPGLVLGPLVLGGTSVTSGGCWAPRAHFFSAPFIF